MLIAGQKPDQYQMTAIKSNKNTLLIAAAGSGKTFTILGKIIYLTTVLNIKPENILVISFTNKSVADLKKKISLPVDIFTFHKLALNILKTNKINYSIAPDDLLEYITKEYFYSLANEKLKLKILKYYHYYTYEEFLSSSAFSGLQKIITTFIHLYKTNAKTITDIKTLFPCDKLIMTLISQIFFIYQKELRSTNAQDFDDLIITATKYADNYKSYQYIIIDEFQDTSLIRWNLVNKIRLVNKAKIFAVGDDYQSIFKFSGCDINIFLNFTFLVEDAIILKLKYTYRNSQELIDIASRFIRRNKAQIEKQLLSPKHLKKPLKISYFGQKRTSLLKLLHKVLTYEDILVLGRNNFDLKNYLPPNYPFTQEGFYYKAKFIRYLTVHSAKGLEADCVIVINLENNLYGFPNQLANPQLIDLLQAKETNIMYAEERRLFYVALTRTRNEVYLLVPWRNKSIFVKEIKKYI